MRRLILLFCMTSVFILAFILSPFVCTQAKAAEGDSKLSSDPISIQFTMQAKQGSGNVAKPHEPIPVDTLQWILVAMFVLVFIGVFTICLKLNKDPQWSIARALSDNSVVSKQGPGDSKNTIMEQIDFPSSSRLIAFLGMVVLLATFLAIGSVMVWTLGRTGQVSGIGDAQGFLWAGLAMFAPYLFNQGKEALKAFGKTGA